MIVKGIIVALVAIVAYFAISTGEPGYARWDSNVHTTVTRANGQVNEYNTNVFGQLNAGDHATMTVSLPADQYIPDAALRFCVYSCTVNATWDGQTIYSYGNDIAQRGDMIGAVYPLILIPEEAWGHSITIDMQISDNFAMSRVNSYQMWPADQAYRFHLEGNIINLLISIAGMVLSVVVLIVSFMSNASAILRLRGCAIGLFVFTISLWIFCNTGLSRLFSMSYFWTPAEYYAGYGMPIAMLGYMILMQPKGTPYKVLCAGFAFVTVFFVTTTALNTLNILHYPDTLNFGHIVLLTSACMVLAVAVMGAKQGDSQAQYLVAGLILAMLVAMLDLVRFNFVKLFADMEYMDLPSVLPLSLALLGLFFFLSFYATASVEHERSQRFAEEAHRLENELLQTRVRAMMSQMQPHFLYNALSSIRAIVKVDPEYAYNLLYDFTVHLRSTIRSLSSDDLIPFSKELDNIKAYLNIERMRFGENLHVDYQIECEDFDVVPLAFQPFAENAARHGIQPLIHDGGGTITIKSYKDSDGYWVIIEDDGCGFDVDKMMAQESDSVGLKNSIFRLKSLMNATVDIESEVGKGTCVRVFMPLQAHEVEE